MATKSGENVPVELFDIQTTVKKAINEKYGGGSSLSDKAFVKMTSYA